jgi:hypothetical protein
MTVTTAQDRKTKTAFAKARLTVQTTHAALLAVAACPYPTANQAASFERWSKAVRDVVRIALIGEPYWSIESWEWDDHTQQFSGTAKGVGYVFDGSELRTRGLTMRLEVLIQIDPKMPLDQEVQRLQAEMQLYRDAVALMEDGIERLARSSK